MTTLLVGFDSAWTRHNSGALVGALFLKDHGFQSLGPPRRSDYREAEELILRWQNEHSPTRTIVMLDQPTIVTNARGQRPVENIVASPVSLRHGGMQPASTSRDEMFGTNAPVWDFLTRFGGPADPQKPQGQTSVFETYPVLAIIAFDWLLPGLRPTGRLPKYNPERKTFNLNDWKYLCNQIGAEALKHELSDIVRWVTEVSSKPKPAKKDQDCLDACLCLIVAIHMAVEKDCLMVGDTRSGYMVVPYCANLADELRRRLEVTLYSNWDCILRFSLKTT